MGEQALNNIRVLDLARVLAGPWCAQTLADLGAEIIKIERPKTGDDTRRWGPPWLKENDGNDGADSSYFAATNRGKKSVTVDISTVEGQEIIRSLAAASDIFIENYKVGDMKRYGLDYETIRKINPSIIYCSITGYGQSGPSAHKPGYDFVFQGIGGLMSITGERDDLPGGGPQKMGIAVADVMTGMYALTAILAALHYRNTSGKGQYIDMALLDCLVTIGGNQAVGYLVTGDIPKRYGNEHASLVPYQVFKTLDAEIVIAVGNDTQWQRFCDGLGRPDIGADERYTAVTGRVTGRHELIPELSKTFLEQTTDHWIKRFEERSVPCGAVNNYKEVFEEPQVIHRELQIELSREDGTKVPAVASPFKMSETAPVHELPPPYLGEHTEEVLQTLTSKTAEQIAELRNKGVL